MELRKHGHQERGSRAGRGSKRIDLSENVLPFLVTRVAYLISASRLTRVGHNSGLTGFYRHRGQRSIYSLKKS